jgi:nucleoside-diphosphate-sugar epimerase
MRVLVTGHKGYIGSKIFNKCKNLGYDVLGIDLKEDNKDILNIFSCKKYIEFKPEIIFHLAANPRIQYTIDNPSKSLMNNVYGTSVMLEYANRSKTKRFVFSSSSSIYGNGDFPVSPYGLHKLQSELECRLYSEYYGLDTVSLRYFNVFSEDQIVTDAYPTVIAAWMQKIREQKNLIVYGKGNHTRDYIHVDDIVDCNLYVANYKDKFNGKTFDVGRGKNYSLNFIKEYILSKHNVFFEHLEERKCDPLLTMANIEELNSIGWNANIDFISGLDRCFNRNLIKE